MPHIHEKIDFTAEVFIVHKDKVLLRMHDKFKIWLSVGGHIELDENPVQAAIREVKEEVGLDIKIAGEIPKFDDDNYDYLITPKYLGKHKVNDNHEHIVFVYFATTDNDEIKDPHSDHERAETKWFTKEELKVTNLRPNVLHLATEALNLLGK